MDLGGRASRWRHHGGGYPDPKYAAGVFVMSNPLPLDSNGNQMQMCIAEEAWSNVAAGTDFDYPGATTAPPPNGRLIIRPTSR